MRTVVDTNVLLSAIIYSELGSASATNSLVIAAAFGTLTTSAICYAELARRFSNRRNLDALLEQFECAVRGVDESTAFLAGRLFEQYRERGGSRERILADFLIAADAILNADRLLTRDHRFFGTSFDGLVAVAPEDL
ncbi:type II toxin-antitoxin system VapC family toxin [Granulicella tundricola]|uniref:PilT protein domain protein n=1 Tax=Granulicella tundricola (strain ATCC BAA-1859 / DSM 23138 / MP5ACTX9) TaxID=1198114 RepID=E8WW81_GRATM|nr:PIN domain-containing protein [Granulicella tundricola]ADW68464.1 PilT protein domain protein [Granulicella tundricola MP5ACTX9]